MPALYDDPMRINQDRDDLERDQKATVDRSRSAVVSRGFGLWQADLSIGKATKITERVRFIISMDMINAFNHVNFADPSTSLTSPSSFGVITSQRIDDGASQGIGQRRIQFGGRIEF